MDPQLAQVLTAIASWQKQMSDGLQATDANLAVLMAASDRRQETFAREAKEGRQKHWDDPERFQLCRPFSGKQSEWDEWSERLLGTNQDARSPSL